MLAAVAVGRAIAVAQLSGKRPTRYRVRDLDDYAASSSGR